MPPVVIESTLPEPLTNLNAAAMTQPINHPLVIWHYSRGSWFGCFVS